MSLLNGSMNMRCFYLLDGAPADLSDRMQERGVPPDETVAGAPVLGWHDVKTIAGYRVATLRVSQRKVNGARLKEEAAREVEAHLKNGAKVNRKMKAEIKAACEARLLPQTPVTHSDLELVWKDGSDMLFTTALSDSAQDRVTAQLALLQVRITGCTPVSAPMKRTLTDVRLALPLNFNGGDPMDVDPDMGAEFLTWLWFVMESSGHVQAGAKDIAIVLQAPITVTCDRAPANEVALKGDQVTRSVEAMTGLVDGKRIVKAHVCLAEAGVIMGAVVDSTFAVRGLKPKVEKHLDAASAFQQRMIEAEHFVECLLGTYDQYLVSRADEVMVEQVHAWARAKRTKED